MKRNFFISKADREKIIAMGQKAMDEYKKVLPILNVIGCYYIKRNTKLLDKLTIQYYIINLN
ncbi:hypothetical protein SAMN02787074_3497 [Chryseobacterium sp. YR221]|nr:hypothetical protein SAMN02787074_3497 [Chryseobacterium sp. YR221]